MSPLVCLPLPATWLAAPSPSVSTFPVARPTASLALPFASSTFPLARSFVPDPMSCSFPRQSSPPPSFPQDQRAHASRPGNNQGVEPPALTGLLLAGGRGARMGRDKATVEFEGEPLARRVARVLSEVAVRVIVASGDGSPLDWLGREQVPDDPSGAASLSGLVDRRTYAR